MELGQVTVFGEVKPVGKPPSAKTKRQKSQEIKNKISILYNLYEKLFYKSDVWLMTTKEAVIKDNIIYYVDERQAEPIGMSELTINDINQRIKIMSELLQKGQCNDAHR